MKLFFWRRKPKTEQTAALIVPVTPIEIPSAGAVATIERSQIPTRPLAMPIELRDALLRFALDCLIAAGARTRVEAADLVSAVLPDGTAVRYTTSLTQARDEEGTDLLVQGGAVLARLLDECAKHAAVAAIGLEGRAEPLDVARSQLAAPASACGRCARHGDYEQCQRCPLRDERIVLDGIKHRAAPRLGRAWTGQSVELTYHIVASDRQGRRDEWVRLAFDAETGRRLPLLSADVLVNARPAALPADGASKLESALAHARAALQPQLRATGALLRLMAEREYRARRDDIQITSQRLLRESPDDAPAIHESLERELARLSEVYAIDVDARLASVCFVERSLATIAVPTLAGTDVALTADLSAGVLLAPVCAACETETRAAHVCEQGHIICPACLAGDMREATTVCPICAGAQGTNAAASMEAGGGSEADVKAAALTLDQLDAMSADSWRVFVAWLLEQEGHRIESGGASGSLDSWRCRDVSGDRRLLAATVRPPACRRLDAGDVERVAALGVSQPERSFVLISTAPAGASALDAARRLKVRLLDRAALAKQLDDLAVRQLRERELAERDMVARAEAATAARAILLGEIQRAEEILAATATRARRAAGRSAVAAATTALTDALAHANRALLAWETLTHDWAAAFDEREARDGSLHIRLDVAGFDELAARARHLGEALAAALGDATATAGVGDLGYTAWRRAVMEQLAAACQERRWHILAIDPATWREFALARDLLAQERAATAAQSAAHAATRTTRAYGELARRARLEESSA